MRLLAENGRVVDLRRIEEGYPKWPTGSGFHPVGHTPSQVRVLPLPPTKQPRTHIVSTIFSGSWPSSIWTHGGGDAEQITVEHSYSLAVTALVGPTVTEVAGPTFSTRRAVVTELFGPTR